MARHVTPAERRAAILMDFDRAPLENKGSALAARMGSASRIASLRAARSGGDPLRAVRTMFAQLRPQMVALMTSAHMAGRLRAITTANASRSRQKTNLSRNAYTGAIHYLSKKLEMNPAEVSHVQNLYGEDATRILGIAQNGVEQRIESTIADLTKGGATTRTGVAALRAAFDDAGITPANSYTLENIFRTQTQLAYSAGRWNAMQDDTVQEILWGFKYATVGDARVRPTHAAMDGVTLPKDDEFWTRCFPPNGYSCRCSALEIYRPETNINPVPIVVDGKTAMPVADPGFRFNPGEVFRDGIAA